MRPLLPLALVTALAAGPTLAATPVEEARIELTTYATIYGAGLGLWTALEFDLSPRPAAWLSAGLAGGALWGTWEAAKARDIQPNQAGLISSAAVWTMLDVVLLSAAFDTFEDETIWLSLGAGAAAAGLAFAAAPHYDTSVGDLSLINSGGLWMPIGLTLVALPLADEIFDAPFVWLLATSGVGLGAGALLAGQVQPTRAQALYLDAGLGVGLVGGSLLGLMGAVLTDSVEVGGLIALGGLVAGGLIAVDIVGLDGAAGAGEPTGMAPAAQRRAARARRPPPPPIPLWVGAW